MRDRNYALRVCGVSLGALIALAVTPLRADEAADGMLTEVRGKTAATQTLTGDFSFVQQVQGTETKFEGKFQLKRPNFARIQLGEPLGQTIVSDGKNVWMLFRGAVTADGRTQYQYTKRAADPDGLTLAVCAPITLFFHPGSIGTPGPPPKGIKPPVVTTKLVNKETLDGAEYQVIEVSQEKPIPTITRLYIGADKRLARMMVERKGANPSKLSYILKNIKTEAVLNDRDFVFTPPKDAKLLPTPAGPLAPPKGKPEK